MIKIGNISLSMKLSFLLLIVLGVLLLSTVILLFGNTANLTEEIGGERIREEVSIMQNHLDELQKQMSINVTFTSSSIPFIQAVGRRNSDTVTELITTAKNSFGMDDIDVIDGDGKNLADLNPDAVAGSTSHMLDGALNGTPTTGLIERQANGQVRLSMVAVAPVNNIRQGTVLGAIQMSKNIDNEFLRTLAFKRDGVYLGLIYNNQILARTITSATNSDSILHNNISFNLEGVERAETGETVILDKLVASGNIPYAVAYIPIMANKDGTSATLMIVVELNQISGFQNVTLVNTITVFTVLALIALTIIYFSMQKIVIQPLRTLKTSSQMITAGHYDERIPLSGKDEVGQLATAFNTMAEAIQQREVSLQSARTQAERSDQVKSAFLASMSHELRTPLNAIINFTRYVAKGAMGEVNEQQVETLNEVVDSGKHLLNLINDVLDMSKIEADSLKLFVEDDIDVRSILQSVLSTAKMLTKEKGVTVQEVIQDNLPHIRADRQRILQILLNIVSNACKFTEHGFIKVQAYTIKDELIFVIQDSGPGISAEDQASVFQPFKQTTTGLRQGGGTGLGMPISKSLAEAHGGRIWIESELGKGTTFYCSIPIKSEELIPSLVA